MLSFSTFSNKIGHFLRHYFLTSLSLCALSYCSSLLVFSSSYLHKKLNAKCRKLRVRNLKLGLCCTGCDKWLAEIVVLVGLIFKGKVLEVTKCMTMLIALTLKSMGFKYPVVSVDWIFSWDLNICCEG
jgi:hypothetical protein